jgi:hypothetical protein
MNNHFEQLFLQALVTTIVCETAVVFGLIWYWKQTNSVRPSPVRIVGASCLASVATLPYLWFVLPAFIPSTALSIVGAELAIVIAEAVCYHLVLNLRFTRACVVSAVANAVSVSVGLVMFRPW